MGHGSGNWFVGCCRPPRDQGPPPRAVRWCIAAGNADDSSGGTSEEEESRAVFVRLVSDKCNTAAGAIRHGTVRDALLWPPLPPHHHAAAAPPGATLVLTAVDIRVCMPCERCVYPVSTHHRHSADNLLPGPWRNLHAQLDPPPRLLPRTLPNPWAGAQVMHV